MNQDQLLAEAYSELVECMDKEANAEGKVKILEPSAVKPERDAILLTKHARLVFKNYNIGLMLKEMIDTSFRPGEIEWAQLTAVDLNSDWCKNARTDKAKPSDEGSPSTVMLWTEGKSIAMKPQPHFSDTIAHHVREKMNITPN